MIVLPASEIVPGNAINGIAIDTVVNHPSGIAFLDLNGKLIEGGWRANDLVMVTTW